MRAIVYTSKSGHTAKYAQLLGELTELPVYSLKSAAKTLEHGSEIIYLGRIVASNIKGLKRAMRLFRPVAVCGVGLCDTGTIVDEVRAASALPQTVPLFTMQGGLDRSKLNVFETLVINMLTKALSNQKERTETDDRMLYLLTHEVNGVCKENTAEFMKWFGAAKGEAV